MEISSFPHGDGNGWLELESRESTPLPSFLTGGPPPGGAALEDGKAASAHGLGMLAPSKFDLLAPTCDIVVADDSSHWSASLLLEPSARQFTPMCLGLSVDAPEASESCQAELSGGGPGCGAEGALCCGDVVRLVLQSVGGLRDAAALRAAAAWLAAPAAEAVAEAAAAWYLPLRVRGGAEDDAPPSCGGSFRWPLAGKAAKQVSALLGPRLWSDEGSALQPKLVHVMLEAEVFRPTCGFAFGVVPDEAFLLDPRGSRRKAWVVDHYGRLHSDGRPWCLYGMHFEEADRLSMFIEPEGDRVRVSFALNATRIQCSSFVLPRCQAHSAVVYLDACQPGTKPTQLRSPAQLCNPKTASERVLKLILRGLGPELEGLQLSPALVEQLTLQDLKRLIAQHYSTRVRGEVSAEQVQVWVGSSRPADEGTPLVRLVQAESGGAQHLKDIFVHVL